MLQLNGMEHLVDEIEQALGRALHSSVRSAFLRVPRHLFIEQYYQQRGDSFQWDLVPAKMEQVYRDEPLVTLIDQRGRPLSSSSQPSVMAVQLETLDIREGDSILEIGAGTGYNAALMSELVGPCGTVTSIDINADLIETAQHHIEQAAITNVHLLHGDGAHGYTPHTPYDRILATCGVHSISGAWVNQLKPQGLLICNLLTNLASLFLRVEKNEPEGGAPFLEGNLLDITATYMAMHIGTLPKKNPVDWSRYDSLPSTTLDLAEPFETLLQNPAYSLLLQGCIPGMTKRYRSIGEQAMLCLLTQECVIQIQDNRLIIYGNDVERACMGQHIQQSIDCYNHLGRPQLTAYYVRISEQKLFVEIGDQSWSVSL